MLTTLFIKVFISPCDCQGGDRVQKTAGSIYDKTMSGPDVTNSVFPSATRGGLILPVLNFLSNINTFLFDVY